MRALFEDAPFMALLGITADAAGEGWCEASMPIAPALAQHGHVHAGAVTTLADHTAGSAAYTVIPQGSDVITIEFKIKFCRLRAARACSPAPSCSNLEDCGSLGGQVYADDPEKGRVLVAKLMSSLAVIPMTRIRE